MLKYEPLLNHIQIPDPVNAFNTLEQFDTIVFDELKAYHEITKYVISDNKLYYDCFSHCSYYTRFFTEYLNSIVEKNQFENTLFYLFSNEGMENFKVSDIDNPQFLNLLETVPAFMFNRDTNKRFEKEKFLLPDPYIIGSVDLRIADSWGDAVDMITRKSEEIDFDNKVAKIFWRGAPHIPTADNQDKILFNQEGLEYLKQDPNVYNHKNFPRIDLVKLSAKNPDIIDAKLTFSALNERKKLLNLYEADDHDLFDFFGLGMSPNFHVNFKYLISLDGTQAAWGRVPWILFSNSLLIKDDTTKEQWFYPLFKDKENVMMVDPNNLDSLFEIYQWCEDNQDEVKTMIENAQEFANNYLRTENIDEYTVEAIRKYTKLLGANYYKEKVINTANVESSRMLRASELDNKRGYDIENKPQDVFKILDLPIMSQFLMNHVTTLNKILLKKGISLHKEMFINVQKAKDLFGSSKIDGAFIKNFFEDRSIITSLIGVDLADFFSKLKIKFEKDEVFLKEIDSLIEDAMKIKNFVERAAIAGSNFMNKDKDEKKNS